MVFINISFLTLASRFILDLTDIDSCAYILVTTKSILSRDRSHLTCILGSYLTSEQAKELAFESLFTLKYAHVGLAESKQSRHPSGKRTHGGRLTLVGRQTRSVTMPADPYLTSAHVMQVMFRLFVVIRFKATDVSLSEVGCAPHLKKNSCKKQTYNQQHTRHLGISPV